MANLASVLKSEIGRLARKELRADTEQLKKLVAAQRSEIAALKRRTAALEKALRAMAKRGARAQKRASASEVDAGEGSQFRFRADGMASNRKRLGLSSGEFGALLGVSGASVLAWESGRSRPGSKHLAGIASLRGAGKREVVERLEALQHR